MSPTGRKTSGCVRVATLAASLSVASMLTGEVLAQAPLGPAETDSPVTLEAPAGGFLRLDLSKKDDKTSPVIQLGYQVHVGDAARRARAQNPDRDIHGVWYYSANVSGTPSEDVAGIFGDGELSTGAELHLSIGQAYLQSSVVPRNLSVTNSLLNNLQNVANQIEALRLADAKPDAAQLQRRQQTAERIRERIQTRRNATQSTAFRLVYDTALRYADEVIAYAKDGGEKPDRPDSHAIFGERGGAIYDAWFVRLGASAGSATLFDAGSAFGEQFRDKNYNGYSLQAGYSVRYGGSFPVTLAFSAGAKRASNVDDLKSVEVAETQTFTSEDGVTRRQTTRKRNALVGEFEESTSATGKIDIVLYPGLAAASRDPENLKSTIAIDLFGRANRGERTIYGVGAYITRPGSPTSVYGGLNVYRAENAKLAISLSAGFPF